MHGRRPGDAPGPATGQVARDQTARCDGGLMQKMARPLAAVFYWFAEKSSPSQGAGVVVVVGAPEIFTMLTESIVIPE